MRIIVMYDLDMTTEELRKSYTKFHKWLLSRGYIMVQYSIYMKIINAPTKKNNELIALKNNVPNNGNIRFLTITNRQYYDMELIRGGKRINETINTESRRIKIKYDQGN